MRYRRVWAFVGLTCLASCAEPVTQETPSAGVDQPSTEYEEIRPAGSGSGISHVIIDGRDGGGRVVYFLHPISTDSLPGTQPFDATAEPTVTVCETRNGECVKTVAQFPWNDGRGTAFCVVVERTRFEWYVAKWIAPRHRDGGSYRAQVWVNGKVAASADIRIVERRRDLRSVPPDVVGVVEGTVLPIRFRIETAPPAGLDEPISVGPESTFVEVDDGSAALLVPMGAFDAATTLTLRRGLADPGFQANAVREVGDFGARLVVPEVFTVRSPARPRQVVVVELRVPTLPAGEGAVAIIPLRLPTPGLPDLTPVIWVEQVASSRPDYSLVGIPPQMWRQEGSEFRLDVWQGAAPRLPSTPSSVAMARRIDLPISDITGVGLMFPRYCNDFLRHPRLRSPIELFPLRMVGGGSSPNLQAVDWHAVQTRLEAPTGTEVRAMIAGEVVRVTGSTVVVQTPDLLENAPVVTRLLNLTDVVVTEGEDVVQGQLLGLSAGPFVTVEFGRSVIGAQTGYLPPPSQTGLFWLYSSHWEVATCLSFELAQDLRRNVRDIDAPIVANPIVVWEAGEPVVPADTIQFRALVPYTIRSDLASIGVPVYSNRVMTPENGTPIFGLNTLPNWPYGLVPQGAPVVHPGCDPLQPVAVDFVAPARGIYSIVALAGGGDFGDVIVRRMARNIPTLALPFGQMLDVFDLLQGERVRYEVDPRENCGGDTTDLYVWVTLGTVQTVVPGSVIPTSR